MIGTLEAGLEGNSLLQTVGAGLSKEKWGLNGSKELARHKEKRILGRSNSKCEDPDKKKTKTKKQVYRVFFFFFWNADFF